MSTPTNEVPASPVDAQVRGLVATRPLYWSVRRELWENRSLYVAPLAVAGVVLFGFLISVITLPHRMHALLALGAAQQRAAVERPYAMAAGLIILTAFVVGVFYCLEALHGERRDRAILFWKSLPVSDLTSVLSKASLPLMVLPPFIFAVIVATQAVMLLLSSLALLGSGPGLAALWARLPILQMWLALLYAVTALALWHAPIYCWLLLVSAWARRATFLWAVLPLAGIAIFERIAFHTLHFASLLQYRFCGWLTRAFLPLPGGRVSIGSLVSLDPGRFLATPGLWIGLAFAAAFLAVAVRLRRSRGPL